MDLHGKNFLGGQLSALGQQVFSAVNPANGQKFTALSLPEAYQDIAQDGLLGMALHPQLLRGGNANYVYLFFTYDAGSGLSVTRRGRVRRYTYDEPTAS